jgi:acyl carrier protein
LHEQLLTLLAEFVPDFDGNASEDTVLLSSGLVESTALLNLVLWVEDQVESPIDIAELDLGQEWDTVGAVLDFVERHRGGTPGARP